MKHRKTIAAVLFAAALLCAGVATFGVRVDAVLPVPADELGLAANHAELAAPVAAQMPTFFVVGAEDQQNERKNVRLWEFAKLANGGKHLPNYPQETGDCVSFGAKNACEYFLAAAMGKGLLESEFHPIFPPYIYGVSRVTIGKGRLGRSPGSVGAWAAEGVGRFGVLRSDADGVPEYSGKLADEWGHRGVPEQFIDSAKMFTFDSIAPVRSANDVRDAICNGYPVTIASDFGTKTLKVKDGRRVAVRNARWPHQMCLIGYDGTASEPYWYCVNSWGPNAHGDPMQDEPPGGFWMTRTDVEYIVKQGDSFAYSGFDGFPANEFVPDFSVIGAAGPPAEQFNARQETVAMFPLSPDLQVPLYAFAGILMFAAALVYFLGNRKGRVVAGAAALMLAVTMTAAAQEFQPNFQTLTAAAQNSATTSTSGPRTANKSTAVPAEFAPDFALLATTANAPQDVGGIRASVTTEPPAVDFAIVAKVATKPCDNPACKCVECSGATCRCHAVAAASVATLEAWCPVWCAPCKQWLAGLVRDGLLEPNYREGSVATDGTLSVIVHTAEHKHARSYPYITRPSTNGFKTDNTRRTWAELKAWALAPLKQVAKRPGRLEVRPPAAPMWVEN